MRTFTEIELREVFADIYHYIFDEFGDSDYAYNWAKFTRDNRTLVNSYFYGCNLFKKYKSLIKKNYYCRGSIYIFLVKEGLIEPIQINSCDDNEDEEDSDLTSKFKDED